MKENFTKLLVLIMAVSTITFMSACEIMFPDDNTDTENPEVEIPNGEKPEEYPDGDNTEEKPEDDAEGENPGNGDNENVPGVEDGDNSGDIPEYSLGLEFLINENNDGYKVVGIGNESGENIFIPAVYENLPVTEISDYALSSAAYKHITIPKSVVTIGRGVFSGNGFIESITVEEGNPVYYTKDNCLIEAETQILIRGCKNSIIPTDGSVTVIGFSALSNIDGLGDVIIPECITNIEASAFYNCNALTSVIIPADVLNIGNNAFSLCTDLKTVTFAEGSRLSSIGEFAFAQCPNIAALSFPSSLKNVSRYAFWKNDKLESVTFGEESLLENLGGSAFEDCKGLKNIVFGDSTCLESIGLAAFYGCTSLEEVSIPATVTIIDDHMFYGCTKLKTVRLLGTVTGIGNYAFHGCTVLESIYYNGNQGEWGEASKGDKWNYKTGNYTVYCTDGFEVKS